jgi:hypothetical protein
MMEPPAAGAHRRPAKWFASCPATTSASVARLFVITWSATKPNTGTRNHCARTRLILDRTSISFVGVHVSSQTSLDRLQTKVHQLASRLGAPPSTLPTVGHSEDGARPHIEVDGPLFHYIVVERGTEISRRTTADEDELLFFVFEDVTSLLATSHVMQTRAPGLDSRRQVFATQLQLLVVLSSEWAARAANRQASILSRAPFDDASDLRLKAYSEMTMAGRTPEDAWKAACEAHPLPA